MPANVPQSKSWLNRSCRRSTTHVEPRADWDAPIDQWLTYELALGAAAETLRTRFYQASRFSRIVDKPIGEITPEDVIAYLAGDGEHPLKTETRRSVRSCLKKFFAWAMAHGLAASNPIDSIPAIPMAPPTGVVCPEDAIEKGLASPDEATRIAVMLGAWMGLRRSEMIRINLATDLQSDHGRVLLRIHGKGGKDRVLPVPHDLAAVLLAKPADWLFPGDVDGHAGVDFVAKRIHSATGYAPHALRRRFATVAYYRNGCNVLLISKMLGHSHIDTTLHYIGLEESAFARAVESATTPMYGDDPWQRPFAGAPATMPGGMMMPIMFWPTSLPFGSPSAPSFDAKIG